MEVIKQDTESGLKVFFKEKDKYLSFIFGGNCDLYLTIHSNINSTKQEFIISKENYNVYSLFLKLFSDIENINIFDDEELSMEEKEIYRVFNRSNYKELFNNNTITWYSDETNHNVGNILKIKKEKELFKLEFIIQPYKEGYDRDFNSPNYIPIRFRNSGSSYEPFNIVFMRMYNNMKNIDDINDLGHQIHIEEYLYKVKKKIK